MPFGTAKTQIGKAEKRIAIGVEFAGYPRRGPDGIEEFDDRGRIEHARLPFGGDGHDGVGAQRIAQVRGEEVHAAMLPIPSIAMRSA
ncbi:hypothetical protein Sbs19_18180 [Sphingobium sp. BS19]|nr:hypothetical protein Sbs19_18180 [Sphingobium sp. BS19]